MTTKYLVYMTSVQHAALIGVLVDQAMDANATQTWEDVSTGEKTSLSDLLTLLTEEEPIHLMG